MFARDAELHLLTQTAGNAVATTQGFDASTGRLLSIQAGSGSGVANESFSYDTIGNVASQSWLNNSGAAVDENACYDNLNRLTGTQVTSGAGCTGTGAVAIAYNAIGNGTSKSDIWATSYCFSYGSGAGPHALTGITGAYNGVTNPNFTYDANGNLVAGGGRTITSRNSGAKARLVSIVSARA